MDSFAACVMAMYSDSVDDSATVGCFFDAQEIVPLPSVNTYPPTDFLSVLPPQFASVYPSNTNRFASIEEDAEICCSQKIFENTVDRRIVDLRGVARELGDL